MKRFISFCILAVLCLGITSGAIAQDPTKKPAPGPVPKAVFPPFAEAKLKNGVRVIIVEDHKQPVVWMRTMVLSGSATDGQFVGAANAVASLMDRGTKNYSADDIARKLDFYGATIGAGADADALDVFTSSLKKDLKEVLPLYADVIKNPTFPASEVDKYINEQISGLKAEKKTSGFPGRMMGRKLVYGDHPYGQIPSEEAFKAMSQPVLSNWHKQHFVANNAVIAVVGDVTKKEIVPMLEQYFGDWQKGSAPEATFTKLTPTTGMPIILIDRPGSVQSTVRLQRIGMKRNDPAYDPASFIAAIFAGNGSIGFQNRLFQNIREKHAYTYTPGGSLTASIDPGVLVAVAEVRNAVTDSALDQMLYEYRRLSNEPIPANDLQAAKSIVVGNYLMSLADPGMTAQRALEIIKYDLPKNYFTTLAARINKMSAAELQQVARKAYPPNDIAVIVTGDAKEIKSKLERYGEVQVYDLDLNPAKEQSYAPSDKTIDQVMDLMYNRLGRAALEKVTSREMTSKITIEAMGQTMAGELTSITAAPNLQYEKALITVPNMGQMTVEQGVDGSAAWTSQMGQLQHTQGDELQAKLEAAVFNEELRLRDPDHKLNLLGMKQVNGQDAYAVQITKPSGASKLWYINTTGDVIQREEIMEGAQQVMVMSDFRQVDGVMYPFKLEIHGPQEMVMTIDTIKHNVPVDKAIFTRK